jgi:hypothetical protein
MRYLYEIHDVLTLRLSPISSDHFEGSNDFMAISKHALTKACDEFQSRRNNFLTRHFELCIVNKEQRDLYQTL